MRTDGIDRHAPTPPASGRGPGTAAGSATGTPPPAAALTMVTAAPGGGRVIYEFDDCEVDTDRLVLRRAGVVVPVEPQVFDVLVHLLRGRGRVVTKNELLDEIWGDRFVSESALTSRIRSARRAVGDDGSRQLVIRTAHGRGYEFVATVEERSSSGTDADTPEPPGPAERVRRPGATLPAVPLPLVGRDDLLADLRRVLPTTRLLTLIGPGGVGKTSVAYELARTAESSFEDGVHVVELASVADSDAAIEAVATALDVSLRQRAQLQEAIVEWLGSRRTLLVLDNCEHVIEPIGALVDRLLHFAPTVSVLATSREPLATIAERVWPVQPLGVAATDGTIEDARRSPAVALFVERAQAADPEFRLDESSGQAVVEICRRLDGIPLAIELAAARTRSLDVREIADRLDERFRLLRGVRRGADERHQALLDTVRWSYDLLGGEEQRLFRQLSVFAGSFDLVDVEEVCASADVPDTIDVLTRLADRSMLTVRRSDRGSRYELLETLRAYGRSRLGDDEQVELHQVHADHFTRLAAEVAIGQRGPGEPQATARADAAFADLRSAFRFAVRVGDVSGAFDLVRSISEFAMRTMRYEVFSWAETALALDPDATHPVHAHVEAVAGYGAFVRGDVDVAARHAEAAADLEAARGLVPSGLAERVLGNALYHVGRTEEGGAATARQLALAEASQDLSRLTHACYMHSIGNSSLGRNDVAVELAARARELGARTGSPTDLASGWVATGFTATDDPTTAIDAFAEGDRLARAAGNRWMSAFARTELSGLLLGVGDVTTACTQLAEIVDVWFRAGEWAQQWHTVTRCVIALAAIGEDELATEVLGAIDAHSAIGAPPVIPLLRDRVLDLSAELRERHGAELDDRLRAAGARMPVAEVVERTRRALLGAA